MSQRSNAVAKSIKARSSNLTAAEECYTHYCDVFSSVNDPVEADHAFEYDFYYGQAIGSYSKVREALKRYSITKCAGPDDVHVRLLKGLSCLSNDVPDDPFLQALCLLFKICASTGVIPSQWLSSKLHLLLKDSSTPYADKTRPINLTQMIRRIFEKCLLSHWTASSDSWTQLHAYQGGFKTGYSCMSHLLLSDYLSRHSHPISVFLDLKSAYDRVPWNTLYAKLLSRGCPTPALQIIKSLMMTTANVQLFVNRSFVDLLHTSCGLFQGSILSPFLFDIFIDDLASSLNAVTPSLLFADDVNIKAKTASIAQTAINVCESWAQDNYMIWTLPKCGIVGTNPVTSPVLLNSFPIPCMDSYKYLGVPHHSRGVSWSQLVSSQALKYHSFLNAIRDYAATWSYVTRITVWQTFARPVLEYCLPISDAWITKNQKLSRANSQVNVDLAKAMKKSLKDCYQSGYQFIFQKDRVNYMMPLLSGIPDLDTRCKYLRAGFAFHLQTLAVANPLNKYRSYLSTSAHHVLPTLWTHPLISSFASTEETPLCPTAKPRFKSWLRIAQLADMRTAKGSLVMYTCLNSPHAIDFSLRLNLPDAVNWRLGHLFTRSYCPSCSLLFNRRHVADCDLLLSLPLYSVVLAAPTYLTALDAMSQIHPDHHFTALDYVLNMEDKDGSLALFAALRQKLAAL